MDALKTIIAIVALVCFAGAVGFMFSVVVTDDEKQWARYTYVYAGIEAVAFAAAGFLFGREVHRERAEKAESRATDAEHRATDAKTQAAGAETKGRAVADFLEQKASAAPTRGEAYSGLGAQGKEMVRDLSDAAQFARKQFPRA
jgi:hypothetical protein